MHSVVCSVQMCTMYYAVYIFQCSVQCTDVQMCTVYYTVNIYRDVHSVVQHTNVHMWTVLYAVYICRDVHSVVCSVHIYICAQCIMQCTYIEMCTV